MLRKWECLDALLAELKTELIAVAQLYKAEIAIDAGASGMEFGFPNRLKTNFGLGDLTLNERLSFYRAVRAFGDAQHMLSFYEEKVAAGNSGNGCMMMFFAAINACRNQLIWLDGEHGKLDDEHEKPV